MSRGYGRVQRALIHWVEALYADHRPELWLCVSTLDLEIGEHPESRRRAAHKLASDGLIEITRYPTAVLSDAGYFNEPHIERWLLFARLPLGEASHDYAQELRDEYLDHMRGFGDATASDEERERDRKWLVWFERPTLGPDVFDLGVW